MTIKTEYVRVLREIAAITEAYGENSPVRYLSDYAPRIQAQIQTLLTLIKNHDLADGKLLSIGGWPGIAGIVLHRMTGIEVTLIDHPSVLGEEFSSFYKENGLQTVAFDFAETVHSVVPVEGEFDLIECCQCIEHWNFNPVFAFKDLLGRVLSPTGYFLVTVPSAVCLYRRLFTLIGRSPFPSMKSFIDVAEALPGAEVAPHWKEYTQQELANLMAYAGGECVSLEMKQYPLLYKMSIFQRIHQALHHLHPSLKANIETIVQRKPERVG